MSVLHVLLPLFMLPRSPNRLSFSQNGPISYLCSYRWRYFSVLLLIRTVSLLAGCGHLFSLIVSQHLTLPFVIRRHRFLGPWTRAGVFLHLSYAAINIFLLFFRIKSLTGAGRRTGELALVNLIFLPTSLVSNGTLAGRFIGLLAGWLLP